MNELLTDVAERAGAYLDRVGDRPVAPAPAAVEALAGLGGPLPDEPSTDADIVALLDRLGSPATMASTGGRYFGFVTGGVLPAALGASWLAAAWDQNAFSDTSSPLGAVIDRLALRWVIEALCLPDDAWGALTTGTTVAHVVALCAARHDLLERAGWDVEAQGMFGAPPIQVVVGEEAHASLFKALAIAGLGRDRVVRVPVDARGRMRADALPGLDAPALVCIQAGNVNSGAFDPAPEICEAARSAGAWVHVDGAFGLWARAAPSHAARAAGYELADSWATDAHKWLNVSYDSGIALVRREGSLRAAMSSTASYLPADARQPLDYTPESSRRARGIEIWATLRALGRSGLAALIERTCRLARRFADALDAAGFEILNEVELNQVVVTFGNDARTRRVIEAVQSEGTCWCGGTEWQGRAAMRVSVSSWATTERDVDLSVKAIMKCASACDTDADGGKTA